MRSTPKNPPPAKIYLIFAIWKEGLLREKRDGAKLERSESEISRLIFDLKKIENKQKSIG